MPICTNYDIELWEIIQQETIRQEEHIELIASENYVSPQVMKAQGSQLTNKYAEGYPGKRYYGGCEYVDMIEQLGINRAKKLFSADYANIQPHSGSQANFSVYNALLHPGDTILSMHLHHGGHLTHGSQVNFSGKLYNAVFYGVDENGCINYEKIHHLAVKCRPKMIVGGFSAYSGIINWSKMRQIADAVRAYLFIDMAHIAGLVAAGIYPNPLPHAHVVTATTHKTLAGPRGGLILSSGGNDAFYKKLDASVFPGSQGGPLMHVIAAKAIALKEAMDPSFKVYQQKIVQNAKIMVKEFALREFKVISGMTHNHLFLLDLRNKNITGKDASTALERANIIVNKNSIPNDFRSPFITSGIRIGTPAITRRNFNENDVRKLSHWICDILNHIDNNEIIFSIKTKVLRICSQYPIYNESH
ncbi:serine hydroxymethyltransferase [Blochmannia endosymbiont of Camponotus sp.]|uniref:serine hydroxymethyltransferase n=1 Tax=Blochmannia endosymbiont of Camponotus sp. TaxID=700220 RepID=UPI0020244760|nr:serine hydroxymethyltransferase [Blochmannia endosymbiont of Camponotus sp.]URJ23852.1 serine hydroxymethyltransferase [Blochmannia endosymbiont of Camponotus sp.]URJ25950.1 serine hydroxymethyltransferase [Blochmannia endosymbiont of Camponotus sp.]